MDIDEWMDKAKSTISKMEIGNKFVVKDLFEGVEWNNLNRGDRLFFGKHFKNQVSEDKISRVRYIGKLANNSSQYIIEG